MDLDPKLLRKGVNVLAVSLHQSSHHASAGKWRHNFHLNRRGTRITGSAAANAIKAGKGQSGGDLFQLTSTAVTSVQWRGVTLDGNQVNGNDANATVGWVLA